LTDAVAVLSVLFLGAPPLECADAGDVDDDGALGLTDAVVLLLHLFVSGPAPAPPGLGACGEDPTADALAECVGDCS
jgi:hypothetical protein